MTLPRIVFILGTLLVVGGSLFFFSKEREITNYPPHNETIVAFGDSLVEGVGASPGNDFVSLLSQKLGKPIINLGKSGDTTASALTRLPEVIAQNPGIVLVLLGGNDALQRVAQETTFQNLRTIVGELQEAGAMVVVLGIREGLLRDDNKKAFAELARAMKTLYVSDVLGGLFDNQELMYDRIHPNDRGYADIAERVYHELAPFVK